MWNMTLMYSVEKLYFCRVMTLNGVILQDILQQTFPVLG